MGALKDAPSTSQLTRLHLVRCVSGNCRVSHWWALHDAGGVKWAP